MAEPVPVPRKIGLPQAAADLVQAEEAGIAGRADAVGTAESVLEIATTHTQGDA